MNSNPPRGARGVGKNGAERCPLRQFGRACRLDLHGKLLSWLLDQNMSNRIHVWYIYLYIYHKFDPNVGKYSIHGASGYAKYHGIVSTCPAIVLRLLLTQYVEGIKS